MEELAFPTEEIVVKILTFLPVKSLIRFSCVSKRFHHIILSDPKFAKAHYEAACELKTLTHKLLIYKHDSAQQEEPTRDLESVDLDAPVFGDHSSLRKVTLPFELPPVDKDSSTFDVKILGSSGGIVFLAFHAKKFYIWNPSTGFFKRLPDLVPPKYMLAQYGVGYMQTTDDYSPDFDSYFHTETRTTSAAVYEMRCNAWRSLWWDDAGDPTVADVNGLREGPGILLNEALHWTNLEGNVVSFDLAEYKFRLMAGPTSNGGMQSNRIAVNDEGFLTLVRHRTGVTDCVDVWVMKVYGVSGSWTKLFNLTVSLPPEVLPSYSWCRHVWVMDNCTVGTFCTWRWKGLIRSYHREERMHDMYEIGRYLAMIRYQETLIKIDY